MRRTLLLAAAAAAGAVGTSGCGMFQLDDAPPAEVVDALEIDQGCVPDVQLAERVARATDVDGVEFELWVAPADDGRIATVVVAAQPAAPAFTSAAACDRRPDVDGIAELTGGGWSSQGGRERQWVVGMALDGADTIAGRFDDELLTADVSAGGYFIFVRSNPFDGDNRMEFASPTMTALDGEGQPLD